MPQNCFSHRSWFSIFPRVPGNRLYLSGNTKGRKCRKNNYNEKSSRPTSQSQSSKQSTLIYFKYIEKQSSLSILLSELSGKIILAPALIILQKPNALGRLRLMRKICSDYTYVYVYVYCYIYYIKVNI